MTIEKIDVQISKLENATTGTDLLKLTGDKAPIRVSALLEKGVKLLIPPGTYPLGHIVLIDFLIRIRDQEVEMQATGKVVGEEQINFAHLVEIHFKSFDQKLWSQLFEQVSTRQNRVDELFYKIRGR